MTVGDGNDSVTPLSIPVEISSALVTVGIAIAPVEVAIALVAIALVAVDFAIAQVKVTIALVAIALIAVEGVIPPAVVEIASVLPPLRSIPRSPPRTIFIKDGTAANDGLILTNSSRKSSAVASSLLTFCFSTSLAFCAAVAAATLPKVGAWDSRCSATERTGAVGVVMGVVIIPGTINVSDMLRFRPLSHLQERRGEPRFRPGMSPLSPNPVPLLRTFPDRS